MREDVVELSAMSELRVPGSLTVTSRANMLLPQAAEAANNKK
jgi:hypothetical protein